MKYGITCPQSYRNGPQPPKIPKKKHLNFEHSSLPISIGQAIIKNNLTIFVKYGMTCALTCTKSRRNGPKWQKILKTINV